MSQNKLVVTPVAIETARELLFGGAAVDNLRATPVVNNDEILGVTTAVASEALRGMFALLRIGFRHHILRAFIQFRGFYVQF
jgi:hypothetical protein